MAQALSVEAIVAAHTKSRTVVLRRDTKSRYAGDPRDQVPPTHQGPTRGFSSARPGQSATETGSKCGTLSRIGSKSRTVRQIGFKSGTEGQIRPKRDSKSSWVQNRTVCQIRSKNGILGKNGTLGQIGSKNGTLGQIWSKNGKVGHLGPIVGQ